MCGIAGFLTASPKPEKESSALIHSMIETLIHRGPDGAGAWIKNEEGIALGHRRLAILDLSPCGQQPMVSSSGRFVLIFNGEIYNYLELRRKLDQTVLTNWRGHSDTEVILRSCEIWGFKTTLEALSGMFVIALWDQAEKQLYLARDRLGEKPLYYGWLNGEFVFASELKALRAYTKKPLSLSYEAIYGYFKYGYVPTPSSIYHDIFKLEPGTWFTLNRQDVQEKRRPPLQTYWSYKEFTLKPKSEKTFDESVQDLETLLKEVVGQQMISDVPMGAFLSGGIDSSTIVAFMQSLHPYPIQTYSIGFKNNEFNEAPYAKAVAQHLGTNHKELYVTDEEARCLIPRLPFIYDEPFADSSQIPTFFVAQMARTHVTVALSGDGGDEMFGGYNRYRFAEMWKSLQNIPQWMRNTTADLLSFSLGEKSKPFIPFFSLLKNFYPHFENKLQKLARVLGQTPDSIYENLVCKDWPKQTFSKEHAPLLLRLHLYSLKTNSFTEQMMYADIMSYLPDNILVKVDRAAMSVSLETRAPFLDHRVVEFAAQLPLSFKLYKKETKRIMRQILYKHVPRSLIDRPKQGFGVPLTMWLRGPLKEWGSDLLHTSNPVSSEFLNQEKIKFLWREHISGKQDYAEQLWTVLMFQAWHQETH